MQLIITKALDVLTVALTSAFIAFVVNYFKNCKRKNNTYKVLLKKDISDIYFRCKERNSKEHPKGWIYEDELEIVDEMFEYYIGYKGNSFIADRVNYMKSLERVRS